MRFIDHNDPAQLATLALTRDEALQVVQDLVRQLADAPGAGSSAIMCRSESDPRWARRLCFMLDDAKK